jgi:hypothetical protein
MSDSAAKNRQIEDHEDDEDDDSEDDGKLEGARLVDGGPSSSSGTAGASATSQQAGATPGQGGEGQTSPRVSLFAFFCCFFFFFFFFFFLFFFFFFFSFSHLLLSRLHIARIFYVFYEWASFLFY